MNHTVSTSDRGPTAILAAASILALLVAGMYAAIGAGMVSDDFESPPAPAMLIAAGCYLAGSVIIWRANRRLLVAGAVVNAIVMLLFVASAVRGNATVDAFALGGKAAQLLLEGALLLLIRAATDRASAC